MKYLFTLAAVVLLAGCGNQPETDPAINIPASEIETASAPDLTAGIDRASLEVCRANMQTAGASILMYQASSGSLPSTLEEAGVSAVCPEGGRYRYTVDGSVWRLECPCEPSHGAMENGTPDW